MRASAFLFLISTLYVSACLSSKPMAQGNQIVEAKSPKDLGSIRVTGPKSIKGKVELDQPISFILKLEIQGPPNGAAQIIAQESAAPPGCSLEGFSFSVPLDSTGYAIEERPLSYGAPLGCYVEFSVTIGTKNTTESTGIYGAKTPNYPGGTIETANAKIIFETIE